MSPRHVHILGVCGTFMAGVAVLAKSMGWRVTGMDARAYPPMSDQLASEGIEIMEGYQADNLPRQADCFVIGNVMSRGNPCVEWILDHDRPYQSGPEFLYHSVLRDRRVLAVAGTHGKTTTSSLLAWILESSGHEPGFLIGGIPQNFGISARLGKGDYFVIEADEYDTAFFDKRSKFVHYHPEAVILNNLEFDHADIFDSLADIQKQFHHLLRMIPSRGLILAGEEDEALDQVLEMGRWTPVQKFGLLSGSDWYAEEDGSGKSFRICHEEARSGNVEWGLAGKHNVRNAVAAVAMANYCGVDWRQAVPSLADFSGVRRRQECVYQDHEISIYDDFAHHPTEIRATLEGLRRQSENSRLLVLMEPRSNSMRLGVHRDALVHAFDQADQVMILKPARADLDVTALAHSMNVRVDVFDDVEQIIAAILSDFKTGDIIVMMSNGDFGGLRHRLVNALAKREELSS
ncbi:MAG: UDP-N-acetylmuramate:L-alanyl-gamma-D-glutamyl-meso-diaminopimelate ligase [Gammaproteobacteria bacterium]|nr:MAG: UDP-N-acetylmuramate:L-alanyl-gamma-D-glutamyl-meso-diaminopimelate ligase [Gammaproteobacteria bacterium]